MSSVALPPPPAPQNGSGQAGVPRPTSWFAVPAHPFSLGVIGAIAVVALLGDLAAFAGAATLAGFLAIVGTALVLRQSGIGRTGRGAALLIGACAVGLWLPLRASSALTALNSMVAIGLLLAAALLHRVARLRPAISVIAGLFARGMSAVFGPLLILRSVSGSLTSRARGTSTLPIIRGLLLAVVPVVLLAMLLASADVVFASALSVDIGLASDNLVGHAIVFGFLASSLAGLLCIAESHRIDDGPTPQPLGGIEAVVVLGAVGVLFAGFAITQFVVALGGAGHVLETKGLTRATYAREGFFQLLAVAAFTLILVVGVQTFGRLESSRVQLAYRVAATLVALLTLVIVAVSVIRLDLYADAYGLTMLRLFSTGFALLIGVVFILFAVTSAIGDHRQWFWSGSIAAAVVALVLLNAMNPEAFIAEWNIDHAASQIDGLDLYYLQNLSADAAPALAEISPDEIQRRCATGEFDTTYGPAGFNLSLGRAADLCS